MDRPETLPDASGTFGNYLGIAVIMIKLLLFTLVFSWPYLIIFVRNHRKELRLKKIVVILGFLLVWGSLASAEPLSFPVNKPFLNLSLPADWTWIKMDDAGESILLIPESLVDPGLKKKGLFDLRVMLEYSAKPTANLKDFMLNPSKGYVAGYISDAVIDNVDADSIDSEGDIKLLRISATGKRLQDKQEVFCVAWVARPEANQDKIETVDDFFKPAGGKILVINLVDTEAANEKFVDDLDTIYKSYSKN